MEGWTIGEVARRAGLQPSAIRYYETVELLPKPRRRNGRCLYGPSLLPSLALITQARDAGFSIAEIHTLMHGFAPDTPPSARWCILATRRLQDIQEQMKQLQAKEQVVKRLLDCQCPTLRDCGHMMGGRAHTQDHEVS
jgi:MerR family transcriptional regulator, redox-sensitive transcriptional activator SoxR